MAKILLISIFFSLTAWSKQLNLTIALGDEVKNFSLDESKIKKDEFDYFYKKAERISKLKSQNKKFCSRDFIELEIINNQKNKTVVACARSQQKINRELKKLANLLQLQYKK